MQFLDTDSNLTQTRKYFNKDKYISETQNALKIAEKNYFSLQSKK